jgi:hypothetical protein
MIICCLLVLDSVTSTPQWIRQPRPRVYLKEVRAIRGCVRRLCDSRRQLADAAARRVTTSKELSQA